MITTMTIENMAAFVRDKNLHLKCGYNAVSLRGYDGLKSQYMEGFFAIFAYFGKRILYGKIFKILFLKIYRLTDRRCRIQMS